MAKVNTVTIDDVEYTQHTKTLRIEGITVNLGTSHLPKCPKGLGDDEYAEYLGDLVEKGVFTWGQIASGLYGIVLHQHMKILGEYTKLAKGDGFDFKAATKRYWNDIPSDILDFDAREEWMKTKWDEDHAAGEIDWDASEHVLFPKNVR